METGKGYVTREECEERRAGIYKHNNKQDQKQTELETKVRFFERMVWAIFGVLVSGFAGVIFAVLSLGN